MERSKATQNRKAITIMDELNAQPEETMPLSWLPKIGRPQIEMLSNCKITSLDTLRSYIVASNHAGPFSWDTVSSISPDGKFRVVTKAMIWEGCTFDSLFEYRIFSDEIVIRDTIIDSELDLCDSKRITLTNCIIVGKLGFGDKGKKLEAVELDRCLVLGNLYFGGIHREGCSIHINMINCFKLSMTNVCVNEIDCAYCRLPFFDCEEIRAESLNLFYNTIEHVRFNEIDVRNPSRIDYRQFDLNKLDKAPPVFSQSKLPHDFFVICNEIDRDSRTPDHLLATIGFIRSNTAIESNGQALRVINRLENVHYQKSPFFLVALDAFQNPCRFLCAAAALFLIMTFLYWLCPLDFQCQGQMSHLDLFSAAYFSGTTLTNVYGDIVPIGWARVFAVGEAVFGVIVWNLFTISLVRKWILPNK